MGIFQETKELVMTGYENFDDFDIDSLHRLISILGEMCDIFRIIFGSEPLARFKIDLTEINETDCFKDVNGLKTQIKAIDLSKPNTQEDRPTKLTNFYFQVPSNHKLDYHRHTLYSFQNFEKAFSSVTSGFLLTTTIDLTVGRLPKSKLTPDYAETGKQLFIERFRRGISLHPEFSKNLSDYDRSALWKSNRAVAAALAFCKMFSSATGSEQFMYRVGQLSQESDITWHFDYVGYHGLRCVSDIRLISIENFCG